MLSLSRRNPGARSGRLTAQVVRRERLRSEDVDTMWALFERYYAEVDRARFEEDLAHKHEVILLRDSGDRSLQGFSTVQWLEGELNGRRYRALFSGDTVCDRAYWGQRALNRRFAWLLLGGKLRAPRRAFYWFLISKGYKTYLLLARNFLDFWPRRDVPAPAFEAALLDRLCREKFGAAWRPELGILRFGQQLGRLREGVAPVEGKVLDDPDIRFFAQKNPGHARGDELCCLGRVDLRFLAATARKYLWPWAATRRRALPRETSGAMARSTTP